MTLNANVVHCPLLYIFSLASDAIPSKKPTPIEEQEVRDKNGRRRFHGAFTGGFSAGYCNSVGSEEGWTPASFKSSRSEKSSQKFQKPEDFMDEEVGLHLHIHLICLCELSCHELQC